MDGESFSEAWGRLKEYIRECPHHGFQDEQIMRIFYDGVDWTYKVALNSASNGDFATQSTEGARELIDNMATSLEESSPEYSRTRKVNSVSTPTIEEIAAQVQELLKASGTRREVHMVGEPETGYYQEPAGAYIENAEEVSYVSGQGYGQNRGFNQSYRNHPNLSYRSTNVANPQDQVYPTAPPGQQQPAKQYMPNQSYQGQQNSGYQVQQNQNYQNQTGHGYQNSYGAQYQPRAYSNQNQHNQQGYAPRAPQQPQNAPPPPQQPRTTLEDIKVLFFNGQMEITKAMNEVKGEIQSTKSELESKLDTLETRVKMVETQVAQTAENMKRQPGSLPGRGENPRKDMCAVAETPTEGKLTSSDIVQETKTEDKMEKLGDPGPLNLQIEVEGKVFTDCLCDLGASVNLMSYTAAKSVGLHDFEPANISLRFADSSEKKPLGMVVDLPVKIDKVHIPTDFVVLELEDESKETIILGRPFLNTTGAIINTREGSVVLDLKLKSKGLGEKGQSIDPGDAESNQRISDPQRKVLQSRAPDTSRPRSATGETEWPKIGPDKGLTPGPRDNKIQLESKPPFKGGIGGASGTGSRSVIRPPDPPRC